MASASQRKAARISQKLTFLKDQGDLLIGAVGQYVSGIIATGESWTEEGDNKIEYLELCQMIETAVEFLWRKCEEVSDNQLSPSSGEQSDPISQPTTATVFETSNRQKTAPQTSPASPFNRQPTETVLSRDEIQLKPVLARIAVIEEALCSFRGNEEKAAEQQSGIGQKLKELLSQLTESDKKNNSKFRKIKEQISKISNTQDELDQEHEGRLQSLEKQLQKLCATQDRIKLDMKSQAVLTEKLVHIPDELGSLRGNINVLEARIGDIIDDFRHKHQDIAIVTRDLEGKVMAITESVQVISEDQERKTTLLRELETKLQTLEADSERNVKDVQKQVGKGEANFRILCQMLNDRLTPLEQLRTCLNQRASTRDDNVKMLSQVIQEVAVMSPILQQIELKSTRLRCGFTVRAWFSDVDGGIIRPYTVVYCDVGDTFNPQSGVFTAPVDGLYVTSISLYLKENENVEVGVRYTQGDDENVGTLGEKDLSIPVCWTAATVKGTTADSVGIVDMKAGDMLFSRMYDEHKTNFQNTVCFSCFLLA